MRNEIQHTEYMRFFETNVFNRLKTHGVVKTSNGLILAVEVNTGILSDSLCFRVFKNGEMMAIADVEVVEANSNPKFVLTWIHAEIEKRKGWGTLVLSFAISVLSELSESTTVCPKLTGRLPKESLIDTDGNIIKAQECGLGKFYSQFGFSFESNDRAVFSASLASLQLKDSIPSLSDLVSLTSIGEQIKGECLELDKELGSLDSTLIEDSVSKLRTEALQLERMQRRYSKIFNYAVIIILGILTTQLLPSSGSFIGIAVIVLLVFNFSGRLPTVALNWMAIARKRDLKSAIEKQENELQFLLQSRIRLINEAELQAGGLTFALQSVLNGHYDYLLSGNPNIERVSNAREEQHYRMKLSNLIN